MGKTCAVHKNRPQSPVYPPPPPQSTGYYPNPSVVCDLVVHPEKFTPNFSCLRLAGMLFMYDQGNYLFDVWSNMFWSL